jgi:hypothetical protein
MLSYRARPCPKCQYYVGYSVARPFDGVPEAPVESFCLNCNYRLPVRAVIRGMKKNALRQTPEKPTRALQRVNDFHGPGRLPAAAASSGEEPALGPNYPRQLRAIGQELESRGFKTFNLKCSGDAYFVWSTETMPPPGLSDAAKTESGNAAKSCHGNPGDPAMKMLLDRIVGFQFTAVQIQRLEQKGRQNRRYASTVSDRGCLSHLLRTVGEQVYRRNQRLLAIAWGERHISVVTKTAGGWLDMDVMRSDNLYDLWVRMYLQRSH